MGSVRYFTGSIDSAARGLGCRAERGGMAEVVRRSKKPGVPRVGIRHRHAEVGRIRSFALRHS